MRATTRVLCLQASLLALFCAACGDVASPPDRAGAGPASIGESNPTRLLPTVNINLTPAKGWPHGAKPTPAQGLAVNVYAAGFERPRWIYVLPNGDVLVAETARPAEKPSGLRAWLASLGGERTETATGGTDRITLLRDADGDGVAEVRTTFLSGLESPSGVVLIGDQLYVAGPRAVMQFRYETGATQITAQGTRVAGLPAGAVSPQWTGSAGADGRWLYATAGSRANAAENRMEDEAARAAMVAIVPDDAPVSRGAGLRLASYSYGSDPVFPRGAEGALAALGDARDAPAGYKVVFMPFAAGKPAGRMEDLLTGFVSPHGDAYGRPVAVAVDRTGAVLVADDVGHTLWRVAPARAKPEAARPQPLADSMNERLIPVA